MTIYPSTIDVVTLRELADWSNTPTLADGSNASLSNVGQEIITGFSRTVLLQTGRTDGYFTGGIRSVRDEAVTSNPSYTVAQSALFIADQGVKYSSGKSLVLVSGTPALGQYSVVSGVYTFSTLDSVASLLVSYMTFESGLFTTFSEVRDGTNSETMGVLNGPINSVSLVQVNGIQYGQSIVWNQGGYFVEQGGDFIAFRSGGGVALGSFPSGSPFYATPWKFTRGKGNVQLTYTGGYNTAPLDIVTAVLKSATVLLGKRLREDEGSRTTPQTGSVSGFRSWKWSPEAEATFRAYRRMILNWG